MSRGLWQVAAAVWLAMAALGWTEPWDAKDTAPWHLRAAARLGQAQPAPESAKPAPADSLPYLHLRLEFRPDVTQRKLHQFRVTDKGGQTVAEVHGFHRDRSLVVFEGDWKNLDGLYLDGQGHREPLVPGVAPQPTKKPDSSSPAAPGVVAKPSTEANPSDAAKAGETMRSGSGQAQSENLGPWEVDPPMEDSSQSTRAASADRRPSVVRPGTVSALNSGGGSDAASDSVGVGIGVSRGSGNGAKNGLGVGAGNGVGRGMNALRGSASATAANANVAAARSARDLAGGRAGGAELAGGAGGMEGGTGPIRLRERQSDPNYQSPPPLVLYLSCADEFGRGRIYQVDEHGRILGLVTLPYAATGLALHHKPALAAAIPCDRGKIFGIDALGKVWVILEDDRLVPQPFDVGIAGNSDSILIADNLAHVLARSSIGGEQARELRRFELQPRDRPRMSVAVTLDQHVLLSTDMASGVYRFPPGDLSSRPPVLPRLGGVAADTASLRWAAVQPPRDVVLFDGDLPVKTLHLPDGQSAYRQGLLSFAPASRVIVATQSAGSAADGIRMTELKTQDGSARTLFVWRKEPILDFVVGPRMPWEPYETEKRRSVR